MLCRVWLALATLLCLAVPAWGGTLVVDVLDVGQGDAILVRTEDKTALIDAGLKKADVVGQLKKLGVTELNVAIASHPHADHIGGMANVLRSFPPKLYLDSGLPHTTQTYEELMSLIEAESIPYRTAVKDLKIRLGSEATFTTLFPRERHLRGTRSDLNSNSVVLALAHGEVSFLFTGDAEEPTENALVSAGVGKFDVLKVAHHGSGHSSKAPFLRAVDADIAIISCGQDNRYGHPDTEAVKRLRKNGALVFRTDKSSQVRVISDGKTVEVLEGTIEELASMKLPWEFEHIRKAEANR